MRSRLGSASHCLTVVALAVSLAAPAVRAATDAPNPALIDRGKYLATAGDCAACHTAPAGPPFAGGLPLPTPLGSIVATNITPSKSHGIGNYSLAQFTDALRRGIRADGAHLYPAMPYTAYSKITDEDAGALYAYFMGGVQPVDAATPPTQLPFPFNLRWSMLFWNALFLDAERFHVDARRGAEWNRGAYLVNGLAHCGTCHTPRNWLMAEQDSRLLAGGEVGAWFAPNITSDANSGIGGWTLPELVGYLREGHAAGKSQAAGPMAEAIDASLRHLSEGDLRATATYLQGVPPLRDAADIRPAFAWGAPADDLASIRGQVLPKDLNDMTGPQLFDANCATCHQARGQGSFDGGLPSLFHNAALGRANSNNLVMVMLEGLHRQPDVMMPGFARDLSDQQLATLGSWLTQRYGNPRAQVSREQVASLRAGGATSHLVLLARVGMLAAAGLLAVAVVLWVRHRHRTHSP